MKILLAVDGSQRSLHEARFALQLVQGGLNASFVLANVQEPASLYEIVAASGSTERIAKAAKGAGQGLLAPSAHLLKEAGVPYERVVVTGDPAQAIVELVEEHGCDMVILGTRALGLIGRALEGGSTALRLLHNCPVPVLLVTPQEEDTQKSEE
ncbi:MAG: universal stress protein [Ottowia sp.]|nr:universal stress protein [Ottowia sp.]